MNFYPVVEWGEAPAEVNEAICQYCQEADLHPHNGTYIGYAVDGEGFPTGPVEAWLYALGIRPEHGKALIHFDY